MQRSKTIQEELRIIFEELYLFTYIWHQYIGFMYDIDTITGGPYFERYPKPEGISPIRSIVSEIITKEGE